MKLKATQYLHINSANRDSSESPYNFSVKLKNGDLQCSQNQLFKISVQSFDLYHTWLSVNNKTNSILLYDWDTSLFTYITIPEGNYTNKNLASTLTTLYRNWSVEWLAQLNKFKFTFTSPHNIQSNIGYETHRVLGFSQGFSYVQITSIISTKALRPTLSDRINLHIENISPYQKGNLDNSGGYKEAKSTNCLLSIVNNFSPFDIIHFENDNDLYSMLISEKSIEKLVITLRDQDESLLSFIEQDYNVVLKFETYEFEDDSTMSGIVESLKNIEELIRLSFVSNNLNEQNKKSSFIV